MCSIEDFLFLTYEIFHFETKDRMERNDDHHQGGFKRNNSNNFGNRGPNNNGGPNMNTGYRN